MIAQVRELAVQQRWTDVIAITPSLLDGCSGDERARLHLYLAAALCSTATCADDWRKALRHAHAGRECATNGGAVYAWSLQKLCSLYADMGRHGEAKVYGETYLQLAPAHPVLEKFTPFVVRDLGHGAARSARYHEATRLLREAQHLFEGDEAEVVRTKRSLAWVLAKSGNTMEARAQLTGLPRDNLWHSVMALICSEERNWQDAYYHAQEARKGERAAWDNVDAAEACLILANAMRHVGECGEIAATLRDAYHYVTRQAQGALTLLVLTRREQGGDSPNEKATRGAGGWHPDACFTTGLG